jgi:hypothetical protein
VKARLTAYAGYQLRDFLIWRAVVVVLGTAAAIWVYATTRRLTSMVLDPGSGLDARAQLQRAFEFGIAVFALVSAAVAAQGLIARDRRRGFDRVLFSRRVSPVRFYGQGFVIAGVASVAMAAIVAQLYAAMIHPVWVPGVAALVSLSWLCVGSFAFLLSALTPFYLPMLAVLVAADFALDWLATSGGSDASQAIVSVVQYVVPPAHVIVALSAPLVRAAAVDARLVVWPATYGLVSLVATFLVLRRRPFGS